MKIGIIGTGNMGAILTEAFIDGGAAPAASITITNRTIAKAHALKTKYEAIHVKTTAAEVAQANVIFICVKPLDIHPLLKEIAPLLTKDQCIVSITSPVSVEQLESLVPCSVARTIPSITNRALAGVSLLTFGENCAFMWRRQLLNLFAKISRPVQINEEVTRVSSDIVSCGPALYSYLTERFIQAAVSETKISEETATVLAAEMLIGLGELLKKEYYTLPTLREKVCVKGGVTGEAIKVMEEQLGDMFEHVFQATHRKFAEDREAVAKQFR